MSPESIEQNYSLSKEKLDNQDKDYLDIERGDALSDQNLRQSSTDDQKNTSTNQSQQNQKKYKAVDPVDVVKKMMSIGFVPSRRQIMNASNDIHGAKDSSNKWFAFLLQRLVKQKRLKDGKTAR